jgi:hypothetical protein
MLRLFRLKDGEGEAELVWFTSVAVCVPLSRTLLLLPPLALLPNISSSEPTDLLPGWFREWWSRWSRGSDSVFFERWIAVNVSAARALSAMLAKRFCFSSSVDVLRLRNLSIFGESEAYEEDEEEARGGGRMESDVARVGALPGLTRLTGTPRLFGSLPPRDGARTLEMNESSDCCLWCLSSPLGM